MNFTFLSSTLTFLQQFYYDVTKKDKPVNLVLCWFMISSQSIRVKYTLTGDIKRSKDRTFYNA